ncbi:MAG: ROK family protein [Chloroflexi bacterium]|nr:ROK family protein [Chloroflexota bacterium]
MRGDLAIGIDIGGTNTKIGLVDASAQILNHQVVRSDLMSDDPAPFVATISEIVERYLQAYPVEGIGFSLCSLVNAERTGAFLSVNAPALNHLNIKAVFENRFGRPVQVLNDVNAYALAEYHFGAGQGSKRLLCVAVGTGVAVAAIVDGRMIETWGGVAADAARIILDPGAEVVCNGNVRGSAEALCGSANLLRLARQAYAPDACARDDITAWDVITAAKEGNDPIACRVMATIGNHLGHLLAILSPIFFPHRIVMTGGTSEAGDPLFGAIRERYSALIGEYMANLSRLETGAVHPVDICKGALRPEAAIVGAVYDFLRA